MGADVPALIVQGAQRLCASCGLIWMPTKMKLWSKALQDSGGAAGLDDISINRVIAAEM